jgi:hypothetical protein
MSQHQSQQLADCLAALLSPDANWRQSAELQMESWAKSPEIIVPLMTCICQEYPTNQPPEAVGQMAASILSRRLPALWYVTRMSA